MVFSSLKFLFVFLPAVLAVYFSLYYFLKGHPRKTFFLNLALLIASLEFYSEGEAHFIWVMLLTGGIDYIAARLIESEHERLEGGNNFKTKGLLVFSIVANMGLLFYFKYSNFALTTFGLPQWMDIALPIGISFYTFESMSYTIDVYRREVRAAKSLVNYWAFITFFPHLIAGPIIRYVDLRRQLEKRTHSPEQIVEGIHRFVLGLGKKVLLANPMAVHADYLFSLDASRMDTLTAWLAAGSYTLQIYFDFSGYSDMAIGLGKIFGIDLPENFNYPYVARSVQDFWRRWHITLSNWFRDYLYFPLGGNRVGKTKEYRNLLFVFFVCGLWHGASFNFIFWGLWHGLFLVIERQFKWSPQSPLRFLAHIYVIFVIVFGWVLFRSETLSQSLHLWKALLGGTERLWSPDALQLLQTPTFFIYFILGLLFCTPQSWYGHLKKESVFAGIFLLAVCFLCGQEYNPFIYFRF